MERPLGTLKTRENLLATWLRLRPHRVSELTALLGPPSWWRRGWLPLPRTPPKLSALRATDFPCLRLGRK